MAAVKLHSHLSIYAMHLPRDIRSLNLNMMGVNEAANQDFDTQICSLIKFSEVSDDQSFLIKLMPKKVEA